MSSIDVAIPCYQYGRFLRECVSSVQSQGVDNLRILLIDNASTDDSADVAQALADDDRRIEVIVHPKNLGQHASYNEAIDWANADYFLLLDADDLLMPGCLSRAIAIMERQPSVTITHGRITNLTPTGLEAIIAEPEAPTWEIIPGATFIRQACEFPADMACAPTVVRRTAAQKRAGHYRKELPYTDDVELWLRIALQGDVARTDATQAVRRIHAQQATTSFRDNPINDLREHEAAFASFFSHEGQQLKDRDQLLKLARQNIEDHAYWSGLSHVVRGYRREGLDLLRFANRSAPFGLRHPPLRFLRTHSRAVSRAREILAQFSFTRQERPGLHERS